MSASENYLNATFSSCAPAVISFQGLALLLSTYSMVDLLRRDIPNVIIKFRVLLWAAGICMATRNALLIIGETNPIVHTWLALADTLFGAPATLYILQNFARSFYAISLRKPHGTLEWSSISRFFLVGLALAIGITFSLHQINAIQVARFCVAILTLVITTIPVVAMIFKLARVLRSHRINLRSGKRITLRQMQSLSNLGSQNHLFAVEPKRPPKLCQNKEWISQMKRTEFHFYAMVAIGFTTCMSQLVRSSVSIYRLSQDPFNTWSVPPCEYDISPFGEPVCGIYLLLMTWCPGANLKSWTKNGVNCGCRTTQRVSSTGTTKSSTRSTQTSATQGSSSAATSPKTHLRPGEHSRSTLKRAQKGVIYEHSATRDTTTIPRVESGSFYSVSVDIEMAPTREHRGTRDITVGGDRLGVGGRFGIGDRFGSNTIFPVGDRLTSGSHEPRGTSTLAQSSAASLSSHTQEDDQELASGDQLRTSERFSAISTQPLTGHTHTQPVPAISAQQSATYKRNSQSRHRHRSDTNPKTISLSIETNQHKETNSATITLSPAENYPVHCVNNARSTENDTIELVDLTAISPFLGTPTQKRTTHRLQHALETPPNVGFELVVDAEIANSNSNDVDNPFPSPKPSRRRLRSISALRKVAAAGDHGDRRRASTATGGSCTRKTRSASEPWKGEANIP